jgi:formylglycine-generating enzyme required for sulfatase activity
MLIISAVAFLSTISGEVPAEVLEGTTTSKADSRGMVLIPGGEFVMGNEGAYVDELPKHEVNMSSFYLDAHEITNAQFAEFVRATEYVTRAERDGHCWAYFSGETDWQYAVGTDWRHPQGPTSTIEDKMNHPVVCVSWEDASAYAAWAGKRLPTEAEWEYAARATSSGHFIANTGGNGPDHSHHMANAQTLALTDQSPSSKSHAGGSHRVTSSSQAQETQIEANVWEGHWPERNDLSDGFYYTAPAASFEANSWGIYDMLGNVWEWTADWYDSTYYTASPIADPQGPATGRNRVARGGSWFCSPNYCGAYSTHYRGASPPDHAFNNVGFRCALDVPDSMK